MSEEIELGELLTIGFKKKATIVEDGDAALLDRLIDWGLTKDTDKPSVDEHSEQFIRKLNLPYKDGPIRSTFRGSLIASEPCKRYMVMQMVYPDRPKKLVAKTAAIFDDGKWRHKRIQSWIKRLAKFKAATLLGTEFKIEDLRLRETGHADVLVQFRVRPLSALGKVIIELKGKKHERFINQDAPEWSHFLQAQRSMHKTGSKWAFIVYENKNDHNRHIYKIAYDPKIGKECDALLKRLNVYVDRLIKCGIKNPKPGALPEQEIDSWCSDCPQRRLCFFLAKGGI
jgi:hypothetical protein